MTERLYSLVGQNLTQLILGTGKVDLLFGCSTMEEQRAFFAEHLDNERWDTAVRVLFSRWTQSHFYPPLWSARSTEAKFGEFYAAQIKDAIVNRPVADNYFLHQMLTGRYLHDRADGTPAYLSDDGYTTARRNIHKMQLVNSTVDQCLDTVADVQAFYLSNIFDWGSPSQHEAIAGKARKASSADGAIVLHRSMYGEGQLAPVFGEYLEIRQELSEELTEQERSMLYLEVTVGELVRGSRRPAGREADARSDDLKWTKEFGADDWNQRRLPRGGAAFRARPQSFDRGSAVGGGNRARRGHGPDPGGHRQQPVDHGADRVSGE